MTSPSATHLSGKRKNFAAENAAADVTCCVCTLALQFPMGHPCGYHYICFRCYMYMDTKKLISERCDYTACCECKLYARVKDFRLMPAGVYVARIKQYLDTRSDDNHLNIALDTHNYHLCMYCKANLQTTDATMQGIERHLRGCAMRQAVDQTFDLSRNLDNDSTCPCPDAANNVFSSVCWFHQQSQIRETDEVPYASGTAEREPDIFDEME